MKTSNYLVLPFLLISLFSILCPVTGQTHEDFLQCLTLHSQNSTSMSQVIFSPTNSSFTPILFAYIQNQRHTSPTPDPLFIITPTDASQIQSTIYCAKSTGLQIRIRSGGHDFEGLSYISEVPYVILDMFNLRSITVDLGNSTAWIQSGATLGEVYYTIAEKSSTLGFPAGYWSTVGAGGHMSGGGYGPLIRKYGIASDNIIDAQFIDVNGTILDRATMGEDLFWAIRGGGGGNFGVILSWKIQLVAVPANVTVCRVDRTLEQNATKIVHRWQYVAPAMPKDLLAELHLDTINSTTQNGKATVNAFFELVFLGSRDGLLQLMNQNFPELGLVRENCNDTSWIEAVLRVGQFPTGTPVEILLNRTAPRRRYTKQKSDYVETPIPEEGLEGIWQLFLQIDVGSPQMTWTPYGGRMSEISETAIPYPHRSRNLFMIFESVNWNGTRDGASSQRHIDWIRGLHDYMTQYVSMNPRSQYVNYRDLDLGVTNITGNTTYEEASVWGVKYFRGNFQRLVEVKRRVDPDNFFRNEQSIPPVSSAELI